MKKKRSERRKHCELAVVSWSQKNSPRRRPPSRGGGAQDAKISSAGDGHLGFAYRSSLVKIDARNFEL